MPKFKHEAGCADLNDLQDELQLPSIMHYAKHAIRIQAVDNFTQVSILHFDQQRLGPCLRTSIWTIYNFDSEMALWRTAESGLLCNLRNHTNGHRVEINE